MTADQRIADLHAQLTDMQGEVNRLTNLLLAAKEGFRDTAERNGGGLHQKANFAYESIVSELRKINL